MPLIRQRPLGAGSRGLQEGIEYCVQGSLRASLSSGLRFSGLDVHSQVIAFFAGMGMRLPEKPPLMLVESSALNEVAEGRLGPGPAAGGNSSSSSSTRKTEAEKRFEEVQRKRVRSRSTVNSVYRLIPSTVGAARSQAGEEDPQRPRCRL